MKKNTTNSTALSSPIKSQWQFACFPAALTIALVGLIISFIAHFPGEMSYDSFVMWGMGWKQPWHDWHSPYISLLMTASRTLRDDQAVYLFFQLFFQWIGLYLCAAAMQEKVGKWALLIPLLGFTPMFLGLSGYLHKTPLQANIFLFIFGVIYLHHAWGRRLNSFWVIGLLFLFLISTPLRRFGYLCVIPLLVYFQYILFRRGGLLPLVKYFVGALVISVVSLLVYNFIIYDILNVKRRYKIQTIYQYDLAAIYTMTGINYAPKFIKEKFSLHAALRKEYAKHKGLWPIMNIYKRRYNPIDVAYYKDAWETAIKKHPDIWLQHKVFAYTKSLGYHSKTYGECRYAVQYTGAINKFGLQKSKNRLYLWMEKYMFEVRNCLFLKPWLWLISTYVILVLVLLGWFRWHAFRDAFLPHIVLLTSVGLFYPPYFLVSLDNDLRFTYWALTAAPLSILCIVITLLTSWSDRHEERNKGIHNEKNVTM